MTTHKEALTLALEALENEKGANNPLDWHHDKAITAIEEALAQPDQAPCKTCNGTGEVETGIGMMVCDECRGTAYTTPPQRKERITYITPLMEQQLFDDWCPYQGNPDPRVVWAAAIEAVNGLLLGVKE